MRSRIMTAILSLLLLLSLSLPSTSAQSLAPVAVNRSTPTAQGLMAWWRAVPGFTGSRRFYNLLGGPVLMLTNMDAAGTTSGWATTARQGGSGEIRFDGSDDQLATPTQSAIFPPSYSLALWMKATGAYASDYSLLWTAVDGGSGSLFVAPNGKLATYVGSATIDPTTTTLDLHVWYHIALVVSSAQVKLYINCRLEASAGSPGTIPATAFTHNFGSMSPPSSRFTGAMDDIKFYSRAIQEAELCMVMQESTRGEPTLLRPPLLAVGLPSVAQSQGLGNFLPFFLPD